MQDGSCELVPVKMRKKNGEIREILFSGRVITINNTPCMLSIPFDITNIRQYEEKIWYLASFIELNPQPIFEINGEGIITMHNEATIKTIHNLTGTNDINRFIPDDLKEILIAIQNRIEKNLLSGGGNRR